ncbi:MAG: DUF6132 family protein [Bacteroidota bacterium]|nr:DUF6132 family protein [Bacteroidota bacterium]
MRILIEKVKQKLNTNIWFKRGVFTFVGGVLGFSYYYFIGCYGGNCPISSNPYISTIYGAGIGLIIPRKKKDNIPE